MSLARTPSPALPLLALLALLAPGPGLAQGGAGPPGSGPGAGASDEANGPGAPGVPEVPDGTGGPDAAKGAGGPDAAEGAGGPGELNGAGEADGEAARYDLRPRHAPGERHEVRARLALLLRIRVAVPAANLDRTSEQEQVVQRRYQDEVIRVEEGRVRAVRRVFSDAWDGVREPGERTLRRTLDPLHQRRIAIALDPAGRRVVTVPAEDPPLPAGAAAGERLTERYEALLPREPVTIGATWSFEGDALEEVFGEALGLEPTGRIVGRLRAVREEALDRDTLPERYALIGLEVRASGRQGEAADAPRLHTTLEGTLRFALERGKVATVQLRGEARLRQTRRDGEVVMEVEGQGPVELRKRFWFPSQLAERRAARAARAGGDGRDGGDGGDGR